MDAREHERDRIMAAAGRYYEMAWAKDGRHVAVVVVPTVVLLLVPGWWWAVAMAVLTGAAVLLDIRVGNWLRRLVEEGAATLEDAQRIRARIILGVACSVSVYTSPSLVLLFAPPPGQAVALLFSMTALMLMANQHVMTRHMIYYTSPIVALVTVLSAASLGEGWASVGLGVLTLFTIIKAFHLTGAASDSFNALIDAQLEAEADRDVLEQRVQERTAELEEVTRVAVAANKAKSMFLANMSHELRTPLNAVIGYSEIIEEDLESGDTSECPQHIARVRNSALHLLGLIADVLDISKVEAERMPLRPEEIDAPSLGRAVLDTVAPVAASNGTTCDLVAEPGAATLFADPLRLRQCLLNLASNAAKFTQDGRIILRIYRDTWNGAEAVAFEFADTGIGISAETQARLFEPFVQADTSITRAYGGSGLGLSITRQFARLMGGDVTLQSKLGEGSRFILIVPLKAPATIADRVAA